MVLVSSLGQIFLLPTGVEAFVPPVKAALAGQCGVKKTTVASTIGRSRDASIPSAREGIHVQAAREWIYWWSEGVFEGKEGVQTLIVADLASSLGERKMARGVVKGRKQGVSCVIE